MNELFFLDFIYFLYELCAVYLFFRKKLKTLFECRAHRLIAELLTNISYNAIILLIDDCRNSQNPFMIGNAESVAWS